MQEYGCKEIVSPLAAIRTQERRGHSYALYLRGAPRKNGTPT